MFPKYQDLKIVSPILILSENAEESLENTTPSPLDRDWGKELPAPSTAVAAPSTPVWRPWEHPWAISFFSTRYDIDTILGVFSRYDTISIRYFGLKKDLLFKVRSQRKKTISFGNFSQHGGGGFPKSQNFCKFTKYFFVCQIHSEVLKHVLQRGGGDIWSILSPKVHLILFIPEKKTGVLGIWEVGEGGGVPYSQK